MIENNNHIFSLATKITHPILKDKGELFLKLVEDWNQIVPKSWKNVTYPALLSWEKNNTAILKVGTKNNSLSLKLNYDSNKVIMILNSYFGYNVISKIKFVNN